MTPPAEGQSWTMTAILPFQIANGETNVNWSMQFQVPGIQNTQVGTVAGGWRLVRFQFKADECAGIISHSLDLC
jgi:hypothetical protein